MHNYAYAHGKLPAVVYGKDGRPLYSWRVLLLPYLEHQDLYREFHLDEPWDSPHNFGLLPRMPNIYAPPGSKAGRVRAFHTYYKVFTGPDTLFADQDGTNLKDLFAVGNAILVAEAGPPVPWTAPQELPYDPHGSLPDLNGPFADGFRAERASGERLFIGKETDEAKLRLLITGRGGREF